MSDKGDGGGIVLIGLALALLGAFLLGMDFGSPEGMTFKGTVIAVATFANGVCCWAWVLRGIGK